ncbi:hypothetical protein BDY19DRAFT_923978 [Irpex rosettiformis]|uniref:Uncharacterized protein n=1 Tax=Irpex rosettiformis TaxID=378272 RepID=A0ACB8UGS2_9APHY|nr:hypothetical protein BDY19DRAFT_923978 [Irpex rosettiformis]
MDSRQLALDSDSNELQMVVRQPPLESSPTPRGTKELNALSQRNASQPILKLPDEVLCLILLLLQTIFPHRLTVGRNQSSYWEGEAKDVLTYNLGWMNATHVCSRLRHTALAFPGLWSRLDVGESKYGMAWFPELLRRSCKVPMELKLYRMVANDEVTAALGQTTVSSRMKSLLVHHGRDWFPVLRVLLSHPAYHLESLELVLDYNKDSKTQPVLPEDLFSSHAPLLQRISLHGFDLPWSSLAFPTLTHLSIVCARHKPGEPLNTEYIWEADKAPPRGAEYKGLNSSMTSVANTLRSLPLLQTLILEQALPTEDLDIANISRIALPHLRKLEIVEPVAKSCFSLLDLLDISQLQHFHLTSTVSVKPRGKASQQYYRSLVRFTSDFLRSSPVPITALNFYMKQFQPSRHSVIAISAHVPLDVCTLPDPTFLDITLNYTEDLSTPELFPHRHAVLEPILDALPLNELDTISFYDNVGPQTWVDIDYSLWSAIFDKCSSARKVTANAMVVLPLVPLLGSRNLPTWAFSPPPEPRTPVFPSLKELEIMTGFRGSVDDVAIRSYFTAGVKRPAEEEYEFAHGVFLDTLKQCLLSRSGRVPKLKDLYLYIAGLDECSGYSSETIANFRKIFADVVERTPRLSVCYSQAFNNLRRYR